MNLCLILLGKTLSILSQIFNLGNGSTWPGHIALKLNKHFIRDIIHKNNLQIIVVAGTNGKTTTSLMIKTILEQNGKKTIHNFSGANLLNGLASTLLLSTNIQGFIKADAAIFEVDENALPLVLKEISPTYLVLLNLFRDQLDRYGEVRSIKNRWQKAFETISDQTTFIINADDPELGSLFNSHFKLNRKPANRIIFFGLRNISGKKTTEHASDSTYCPNCGTKLIYQSISYSHLGNWSCNNCKLKRPKLDFDHSPFYPLPGLYNQYNTLAAVCVGQESGFTNEQIKKGLRKIKPAFGRQEVIGVDGKKVQIFLSKNPTSFNESLKTIVGLKAKNLVLILNDRIPDGRDVSWIWDTDIDEYLSFFSNLTVTGDRVYDLALRIKYAVNPQGTEKIHIEEDLKKALKHALDTTPNKETLYILPTYSAMLDARKILTGKKIL